MRRKDLDNYDMSKFSHTRVVCSDHFESIMYNCLTDRNSSLRPDAVPTIIDAPNPPKLVTPQRNPPKKRKLDEPSPTSIKSNFTRPQAVIKEAPIISSNDDVLHIMKMEVPTISTSKTPRHNCNYVKKYKAARKTILQLHGRLRRLRLKTKTNQDIISKSLSETTLTTRSGEIRPKFNQVLQRFITSQYEFAAKSIGGMRWTDADKKLAISIYYKSPSAYRFLRTVFNLPCDSVIYETLRETMSSAGLCHRTLAGMQSKCEEMLPRDRNCVLTVDGIKVQPNLQYLKSDIISGFEELNGQRTSRIATELVVVMAQGIGHHWKQVGSTNYGNLL